MNPFYLISLLSVTAAFLAVALQGAAYADLLPSVAALNWLRVHLITIGTVSNFVFGSAPALLAFRMKGRRQPAASTWTQWGLLNVGYVMLLIGMPGSAPWLASTGAWVIFGAVSLLAYSLIQIARSAPGGDRPAMRYYVTAPFFFLVGISQAVSMLLEWPAPGGRMGMLEAHVHANVWGFLAFAVTGTLLDMLPKLVGRPLAYPAWTDRTYWAMLAGITGLVAGPWFNFHPVTIGGLLLYVAGVVLLLVNLTVTALRARPRPAAAGHLLLGYLWQITPVFFAPLVVMAPEMVPAARIEAAATQGLVLGWVLQMAMGGIPTILDGIYPGVVKGADSWVGSAGGGWFGVLMVNLGVALIWASNLMPPSALSMPGAALGYGLVAVGVIPFLMRLWATFARRFDTGI